MPNNPTQRISPQELRELADSVEKIYGFDVLAEKLRQLADQLERDAKAIDAARPLFPEDQYTEELNDFELYTFRIPGRLIKTLRQALADSDREYAGAADRREETR